MSGTIGEGPSGEKRREVPYLGAVKIASVVMGVMILVGLAVIGVTIAKRLSGAGEEPPAAAVPAPALVTAPQAPGDLTVPVPTGARVLSMALNGRRLAVTLGLPDGRSAVLLIDADTGNRLGLLTLDPAAP